MDKIKFAAKEFFELLSSLELTLAGLGALALLVFLCTLGEVQLGVYDSVKIHFNSWFLYSRPFFHGYRIPLFPAGKLVGVILIANLLFAHFKRLTLSYKKTGLWLTHFGLIILFVGQFLTGRFSRESQMTIKENTAKNYSEDPRHSELDLIDATDPKSDTLYSIPQQLLKTGQTIHFPNQMTLIIKHYARNAAVDIRKNNDGPFPDYSQIQGPGKNLEIIDMPLGHEDNQPNMPATLVQVLDEGKVLGNWQLSEMIPLPQKIPVKGKEIYLALRPKRYYFPFSLFLKKFTHKIYNGTTIPSRFSSLVHIEDPATPLENRNTLISMNHPLRFEGLTFYQASYAQNDTVSILQVVHNPSWTIPYISSFFVALGLIIHFLLRLKQAKFIS